MASSWTACFIFIAAFFSAEGIPLKEDPLVAKVKQIVSNVNTYLQVNKQDQVQLPDFGNLTTDHIALTNIKLGNFSTMVFKGGPFFQQNQTLYTFNVTLRLQDFNYQFDFDNTKFQQQGHMTITPISNYYLIEGVVEILQNKYCHTNLTSIDFTDIGDTQVDIKPDNIPRKHRLIKDISSFLYPSIILWSNYALEKITSKPTFLEDVSNIICQVLVS